MAIEVVPYAPERVEAVKSFNRRMHEAGTHWGWYETVPDEWLPPGVHPRLWREHYLAVENGAEVVGAFALKPQDWLIRGRPEVVTDWQGPVSLGVVSRRYNTLGLRLLREMLKLRPLLFSWGHGGYDEPMPLMLRSLGWLLHDTPVCLYVARPFRFLRMNRILRDTAARRLALDLAAFTGAGWVGFRALHALRGLRRPRGLRVEEVAEFGAWADALWARCAPLYSALAVRDRASMNALLPPGRWPPVRRLRVFAGARELGWAAVMESQQPDEPRFGALRLGVLVDAFGAPEDAAGIVAAATDFLLARGVDVALSNQSHPAWIRGLARRGFLVLEQRRLFAVSPELQRRLEPWDETRQGLHLTNLDGHGPMGL